MAKALRGMSTTTARSFRAAAKKIAKAARSLNGEVGPALRMFGEEIMTDVKNPSAGRGVPFRKGTLRNSGRVDGPTGNVPIVSLSFGGAASAYALIQHEVTTFRHTVGEPRYLVRGMERWNSQTSAAFALLKARARRALSQGR